MKCDVEFAYDFAYTTATAIVEFILPFICLTSINGVIHYKIRQRVKPSVNTGRLPLKHLKPSLTRTNNSTSQNDTERVQRSNEADISVEPTLSNNLQLAMSKDIGNGNSANMSVDSEGKTEDKPRRHIKAAKFLAVLVAAFLVLWAPYTVTTMIISVCNNCVNESLYAFCNFLLYVKSTVNPFLYAFNSSRYRKQFMKYLTLNNRLYKLRSMESDRRVNTTH
jgi:histamine receptor H3